VEVAALFDDTERLVLVLGCNEVKDTLGVGDVGVMLGANGEVEMDVNVELAFPLPSIGLRLRQRRSVHPAAALDGADGDGEVGVVGWVVDGEFPGEVVAAEEVEGTLIYAAELVKVIEELVDKLPALVPPMDEEKEVLDVEPDVVSPPLPFKPGKLALRHSNPVQLEVGDCEVALMLDEVVVVVILDGANVEVSVETTFPANVTVLREILKQAAPVHEVVLADAAVFVLFGDVVVEGDDVVLDGAVLDGAVIDDAVLVEAPLPPPSPSERHKSPLHGDAEGDITVANVVDTATIGVLKPVNEIPATLEEGSA
ncbi:MAG: hypothetical protein Q9226_008825, partial [Calogaya cf. arnoldii]